MQPRFPADHHFYDRRRGRPAGPRHADDPTAVAYRGIEYLTRQRLPSMDPSDPRDQPLG